MKDSDFQSHKSGTYTESYTTQQYGVFTTTKDGERKFIATCVTADSALTKATLYYHDMFKYPQNSHMDMTEIERFEVSVREVTYSPWADESVPAKEAAREDNPWRYKHWRD